MLSAEGSEGIVDDFSPSIHHGDNEPLFHVESDAEGFLELLDRDGSSLTDSVDHVFRCLLAVSSSGIESKVYTHAHAISNDVAPFPQVPVDEVSGPHLRIDTSELA